jgi:hypothetical protein
VTEDEKREIHIASLAQLVEGAMARWGVSGCFHARGQADRYRIAMEELIRGRSPAQKAAA